jgi:hypothetical protein
MATSARDRGASAVHGSRPLLDDAAVPSPQAAPSPRGRPSARSGALLQRGLPRLSELLVERVPAAPLYRWLDEIEIEQPIENLKEPLGLMGLNVDDISRGSSAVPDATFSPATTGATTSTRATTAAGTTSPTEGRETTPATPSGGTLAPPAEP